MTQYSVRIIHIQWSSLRKGSDQHRKRPAKNYSLNLLHRTEYNLEIM
jgi:hypothetical protein